MNYRHAFHAGGFGDVVKHAAVAMMIEALKRKDKPFYALDTHAGIGRYDLGGAAAEKTGEWRQGILKVIEAADSQSDAPAALGPYLDLVRVMNGGLKGNPADSLRAYPGSPRLVRALLRPADRLALSELHPEDHAALVAEFRRDAQVQVHALDGYVALKSFLPPPERRGLVLIDPPFEAANEFERLTRALVQGHRRFATGAFIAWHPIKHIKEIDAFHAALKATGVDRVLVLVFAVQPMDDAVRLNGCGLIMINPPWPLAEELPPVLHFLHRALRRRGKSTWRLEWLAGEAA
ncbi:MAG: 23S rRNA (adenine(2030)-N(6))-methyltransferase RlmJ [Alphaproteobacteria bacterium]|nr:23S rRNA (adenine(2030)-N(6))-methyltransferase RlmJ [Alphaproteobacteria bacterium]